MLEIKSQHCGSDRVHEHWESLVFFFSNYSQWLQPLSSTNGAKEVAGCGGSRQNH